MYAGLTLWAMTGKRKGKASDRQGQVEQLPSGRWRWRVRVTYPDGTTARPTGTVNTKREGHEAVARTLQEAAQGKRPVSHSLTVGEMVTEFMRWKRATWADRTAWNNEALYTRHVAPHVAHLKAAGVTPARLREYFELLSEEVPVPGEEGKTRPRLGYSGQRQIHVLIHGAYARAIADGALRDNPAQYARPLSPSKGGTVTESKVKHFTPEDLARFVTVALGDRFAVPLAFLAYTGLRIGEALALTWGDLGTDDTGAPYVSVSKTRSEFEGKTYTGGPKTAAGVRRVYLSGDALGIVEDMRGRVAREMRATSYRGQGLKPSAPMFPAVDGRPLRQDTLRAVMRRTCAAAGVPVLSPHALRHSTGTYLISRGEDPVSVAALLGHAQVSTTLNIYAHALPGKLRGLGYGLADLQGPQVRAGDAAQGGGPDGAGDGGDVPGEGKTRGAVSPVRRAVRKGGPRRKA
ncbi:site-specific integrase [Deinococcus daejeonensis]|uniref:Site-specific integrase n=2 Tax=Deinococcus daejeonensis TaxID=1007098 RepID=A0ABQ2IU31_9DEIO|nr:site-specific integrase [Deinococcus daejeonensis]